MSINIDQVGPEILRTILPGVKALSFTRLPEGKTVRGTWKVEIKNNQPLVLQQLTQRMDEKSTFPRLEYNGPWFHKQMDEVKIVKTPKHYYSHSGKHVLDLDSRKWRILEYLEDNRPNIIEPSTAFLLGELLSKIHAIVLSCQPPYSGDLHPFQEVKHEFENTDTSMVPLNIMEQARRWVRQAETIPVLGKCICHGDTKLENWLFKKNSPYALVDLDLVHIGNPCTDVGDLLRSLVKHALKTKQCENLLISSFLKGYEKLSQSEGLACLSHVWARLTMRRILWAANGRPEAINDLKSDFEYATKLCLID